MFQAALMILCITHSLLRAETPHILTFFLEPYPEIAKEKSTVQKFPYEQAIFATYFGYETTSDNNGQIQFPLKKVESSFYLLITTQIEPVFMLYNTIHHLELKDGSTYSFYSIERKVDEKTQIYFWDVQTIPFPKDYKIPAHTIILRTNPKNIYVPTGISITTNSPQIVLPPVYVKSQTSFPEDALSFLENKEFFAPINRTYKVEALDKQAMIQTP